MEIRLGHQVRDVIASSSGRRHCPIGVSRTRGHCAQFSGRSLASRVNTWEHVWGVGLKELHRPAATVACRAVSGPAVQSPAGTSTSAASAASSPSAPPSTDPADPTRRSAERVRRLTTLVETRRLYRNCIRARYLLELPQPVYTPPPPPERGQQQEEEAGDSSPSAAASLGASGEEDGASSSSGSANGAVVERGAWAGLATAASAPAPVPSAPGPSPEEEAALKAALDSVAEMALVAEQLKAGLRALAPGFGDLIFEPGSGPAPAAAEERVRALARQYAGELRERLAAELAGLPISSDGALYAIESRNAKYSRRQALDELQGGAGGGGAGAGGGGAAGGSEGLSALERLEAAERVAGQIIANNIKPALKKASEQDPVQLVRDTGAYLKGLWVRLNGGTPPAGGLAGRAGLELPLPLATQAASELAISQLTLDLEALEKRLQEASKSRENKLRKAGLQGRVQMAIQLKGLDAEVLSLSSLLAVRTLQLEMEHVYGSLEAEACDIFSGARAGGLLPRDGSTAELALLVAEFALLDEQLTLLAAALEATTTTSGAGAASHAAAPAAATAAAGSSSSSNGAAESSASASALLVGAGPGAVAAAAAALGDGSGPLGSMGGLVPPAPRPLASDEVLGKLAAEIPDMRSRVGVADQTVFGGQGFSLTRARLQIRDSLDKVAEALNFLSRGLKLLGSDVATAARLFLKAALGNTLKPREVSALRRTARDLLTFVPFTIILIIPLTPLGHVLVFGFIQRYFPSFFPSQFSSRRQDIMVRYEELERQLLEAQAVAEAAEEEVELARAREAVARLTAPEPLPILPFGPQGAADAGTAAAAVGAAAAGGAPPGGQGGEGAGAAAGADGSGAGRDGVVAAALAAVALGAAGVGSTSSVDEVMLQEATQKVRILEEQLDVIRDDVNMGEGEDVPNEGDGSSGAHGASGNGSSRNGSAVSYSAARKP